VKHRLGISLLGALLALALLELGLRLAGFEHPPVDAPVTIWNPARDRAMREGDSMFVTVPRQLWAPKPGAGVPWGAGETINAAGYRGPLRTAARADGVLRVVALGDSSTFGYGVAYERTYPARLEELLAARGIRCEVLDFGVVGYTVRQGLERYRAVARSFRADFVIEAFGAVNDHHLAQGGLDDAEKIAESERGSATGLRAWLRRELRTAHLISWIVDRSRTDAERYDELFGNELARTIGQIDWKGERRVPLDDFEIAMRELAREVGEDGAKLVMLSMPRPAAVEAEAPVLELYSRRIAEIAASLPAPLVDGREAFHRAVEDGVPEASLFLDHWHPTPAGQELLARALAEAIAPR